MKDITLNKDESKYVGSDLVLPFCVCLLAAIPTATAPPITPNPNESPFVVSNWKR